MAKVKIVKNERDPPLFTSKQLIKLSYDIGFVYRRTDMVKPVYPLQLRCGEYKNKTIIILFWSNRNLIIITNLMTCSSFRWMTWASFLQQVNCHRYIEKICSLQNFQIFSQSTCTVNNKYLVKMYSTMFSNSNRFHLPKNFAVYSTERFSQLPKHWCTLKGITWPFFWW